MDHKERVVQKHQIYKLNGYKVTDIVSTEDQSVFFSAKDDVYRRHVYEHNDAVVYLASKEEYKTAGGVEQVEQFPVVQPIETVVEVQPVVEDKQPEPVVEATEEQKPVAVEKPAAKKTAKKKGA